MFPADRSTTSNRISRLFASGLLAACIAAAPAVAEETAETTSLPAPGPAASATAAPAAPAVVRSFERAGMTVEMRLRPIDHQPTDDPHSDRQTSPILEGTDVAFEFEIRDATGEPMSSAFPAAWMDLLPVDEKGAVAEPDEEACRDKLGGFVSGSLLFQPELDLNVYYVLTLNRDASLSVVDPLFGFGGSKLLDMVLLEAPGLDWALTEDQTRLFVSMPEVDGVAVVDTATWEVLTTLRVGSRPTRLALQDDGSHLWIAHGEGESEGVAVVRVANLRTRANLRLGSAAAESEAAVAGEVASKAPATLDSVADIAFSDDQQIAYVTRPRAGGVAVIDVHQPAVLETVATGPGPSSIAWSEAARMAYVGHADGSIVALGGVASPRIVARMEGEAGPGPLRFAPGGRWGFVPVPGADVVHILDAAKNRIVQTGDVEPEPDQVTFSDGLAYVRHRGSEIVLTIPLHEIGREGAPVPVIDFPGGQAPPGRTDRPSLAEGIVQAPGSDAVLVANPEDKMIYFYKEGMAAPMGSFKNYGREPRAVAVVDRSLRERQPGIYRTEASMRRPGTYDVAFFMDAPRTLHCFRVEVAPNEKLAEARRRARPLLVDFTSPVYGQAGTSPRVGDDVRLEVTLRDPHTEEAVDGLEDVTVLTFLAPGTWQRRHAAEALGEGRYEVRFAPPESGVYYAFVGVPSRGLGLQKAAPIIFQVEESPAAQVGERAMPRALPEPSTVPDQPSRAADRP